MQKLEENDMQGLIARGYPELTSACYLLLQITDDVPQAKLYLSHLAKQNAITPAAKEAISPAQKKEGAIDKALHIAFTSDGLRKLGLNKAILDTFSREFLEGMVSEFRSQLLGDFQENTPARWQWGNNCDCKKVDCILLCYASNQQGLNALVQAQTQNIAFSNGFQDVVPKRETYESILFKHKLFVEHFGFRDGISAPVMEGLSGTKKIDDKEQMIRPGEFVLGYKNEYGVRTDSPYLDADGDPDNILPFLDDVSCKKDLGKNGTYLVYRQMEQRVFDFWKYMKEKSREGGTPVEAAIRLGAKIVGRWPGGAPLVLANKADDPDLATANNFGYAEKDPLGMRCPFGAHIRRTNPRDQLHSGRDPVRSKQMVRKHQILRRGRIYGKPLVESMKPEEMLEVKQDDGVQRGLHFICLVGHISRQFEFIQNVWANNFTFADLCNEVDPLISPRPAQKEPFCNEFTVQAEPLRRNYKSIPQFTKVVGGAYFFLPGLRALKFLATC